MGAVWPLRRLVVELERSLVELMRWLNLNGGLRRRSLAGSSLKEMVLGKKLPKCEKKVSGGWFEADTYSETVRLVAIAGGLAAVRLPSVV